MAREHWKYVSTGFTGLLLVVSLVAHYHARRSTSAIDPSVRFVKGPKSLQTRNDADILSGIVDSDGWNEGKNHIRIKNAVAPAISTASKATVRIMIGKQAVAMGTVASPDGHVLTKASEVDSRKRIICRLYDGKQYLAKIVGILDRHDLALLKIEAEDLAYIEFDAELSPGIGSILATPSLSSRPIAIGVVSSRRQRVESDGVLGVRMQPNGEQETVVIEVLTGSAAAKAGIREGDVVLGVDGQRIASMMTVVNIIGTHLPGDEIEFEVMRDNKPLTFAPKLGRREDLDVENGDFQSYLGGELSERRSGFPTVIQHDTFLLPEHCGGPIVDLEGRVVGINIARAERIASYALPNSILAASIERMMSEEESSIVVSK